MVGPRPVALAFLLALVALPASASLVEDATGHAASYQFDGETHHDAPDACGLADATWSLPAGGTTDGMLLPPDDPSDVFVLDVAPDQVGQRLRVSLIEPLASPDLLLGLFAPLCAGDVFAPANQPYVIDPPAPADGEAQVSLTRGSIPQACSDAWTFGLGGLGHAPPPSSIYAAWTDGTTATVPLAAAADGEAWYGPVGPGVQLQGVWANLPAGWNGPLKVVAGVCDAPDGGAVFGQPAQLGNDWIAFTPVRAGPHEVVISLAPAEAGPLVVPLSCHWCAPQVEQLVQQVAYKLSALAA